ncbi:single-stranded DNA-binding protein [Pedococcus sp. 5OH_020]|uniref:single-stranded DNA-binding protein n=1 Tax=Pedococcus sp. 5OH_020 TaxID=2989814 RepID=UPI0022E9F8B4|nr:single-stranded DNA-binding protein [Pedococcus sp. 5OH_020]
MNEIYTTVQGRLVAPPESRVTRGGVPFTAFRLASTVRRPNPQTKEYEDGPTNFFSVTAFRSLGANVAGSLKKGDPVIVYGRMRVNQWMRKDDTPATSVEIDAYSVGHDLTWGTTELVKVSRAQTDRSDRLSDDAVQSVHAGFEEYDDPDGPQAEPDIAPRGTARGRPTRGGRTGAMDADTDDYTVLSEPSGLVSVEQGEQAPIAV